MSIYSIHCKTQCSDHFSQKFCTLKQELLTTAATSNSKLEASARLAQELCTACEKYFIIKRLFWEVRYMCYRIAENFHEFHGFRATREGFLHENLGVPYPPMLGFSIPQVFSAKWSLSPIRKSFLPRKFPAIRYLTSTCSNPYNYDI